MQNLTKEDIQQHAVVNEQKQFCELFHFSLSDADWGADRFQALVTTQSSNTDFQCILCIEWLCEAIWLEPVGTQQSPNAIYQYLQNT